MIHTVPGPDVVGFLARHLVGALALVALHRGRRADAISAIGHGTGGASDGFMWMVEGKKVNYGRGAGGRDHTVPLATVVEWAADRLTQAAGDELAACYSRYCQAAEAAHPLVRYQADLRGQPTAYAPEDAALREATRRLNAAERACWDGPQGEHLVGDQYSLFAEGATA